MEPDNPIGGYFELELNSFGNPYHNKAIPLNSGRNALEYILTAYNYSKIYLPYYTCEVVLQPIQKLKIMYELYHIKDDFSPNIEAIESDAALIYVNYFGIMHNQIQLLSSKFKNLIIDNSQAFFEYPLNNMPTFYSPRKFFGLPDGGYAYIFKNNHEALELEIDISEDRIAHLIKRSEGSTEEGYKLFKQNDAKLDNLPIREMSLFTRKLLSSINYEHIKAKRIYNFNTLHKNLHKRNELTSIIENASINSPMVYPYKTRYKELRKYLIDRKIYVATYWPNVFKWTNEEDLEYNFAQNIIPIPIDQRYGKDQMNIIINLINRFNSEK